MPRRREIAKREIPADPIYGSTLVTKFISTIMKDGKRSTAERIMYQALDIVKEKTADEPNEGLSSMADQFGEVRSALAWCFSDRGDRRTGVGLAAAAIPLFFKLSLFTECQLWVTRAIEALHETGGSVRHDLALHAALASARMLTGQIDELGVGYLDRAVRLAETIGDVAGQIRLIG